MHARWVEETIGHPPTHTLTYHIVLKDNADDETGRTLGAVYHETWRTYTPFVAYLTTDHDVEEFPRFATKAEAMTAVTDAVLERLRQDLAAVERLTGARPPLGRPKKEAA